MYESTWFLKFDNVFFLRDADGKILIDEISWAKILCYARLESCDRRLLLPAEIVLMNRSGSETVIATWDEVEGCITEEIAENFKV